MKKKLSIAGLVLILIFCLAGCGSKSAEKEYDQERLQQYAQGIIDNFSKIGDFTMEVTNTGAVLSAPLKGEERDADLQFAFDEGGQMESITVNAHYSTTEILKKAGLNTVLGMGTVFVVLIFISFIISLFEKIPALEEKFRKKETAPAAPAPAPAAAAEPAAEVQADDSELIAVIAAAIAAAEGTTTDGFVVRSIKRRKSNKWNASVR
ncbi:MAG: OadG family protein [Ruminococcus sp.]|nr:OadG family protein [Ruminococcus sp.]